MQRRLYKIFWTTNKRLHRSHFGKLLQSPSKEIKNSIPSMTSIFLRAIKFFDYLYFYSVLTSLWLINYINILYHETWNMVLNPGNIIMWSTVTVAMGKPCCCLNCGFSFKEAWLIKLMYYLMSKIKASLLLRSFV